MAEKLAVAMIWCSGWGRGVEVEPSSDGARPNA